jgi:hypothetical protein
MREGHLRTGCEYLSFTIWSGAWNCALYCRDRCKAYPDIEPMELIKNGYKSFISMVEKL